MALAAGLVHGLLGGWALEVPLATVAIGAADHAVGLLWQRIGEAVRQAWLIMGVVAVAVLTLVSAAPNSRVVRGLKEWGGSWLASQNAALDRRAATKRTPIDPAAARGQSWQLLVDSGSARLGTLAQAREWCGALGPG